MQTMVYRGGEDNEISRIPAKITGFSSLPEQNQRVTTRLMIEGF
jgi:hypothetical protein